MVAAMRLTLQPRGSFEHGKVHCWLVELPGGDKAQLTPEPGQGWNLQIIRKHGPVVQRGLFATPHDALAVLEAEYYPPGQPIA